MIQSPEHALITGFALGTLLQAHLEANPEVDGNGDYTDRIALTMKGIEGVTEERTVFLRVELA